MQFLTSQLISVSLQIDLFWEIDAVQSERAALVGYSEGGPMCCLFAATYPERNHIYGAAFFG
jgi:pimeloyl-ACP methyl ester carboxylesterase